MAGPLSLTWSLELGILTGTGIGVHPPPVAGDRDRIAETIVRADHDQAARDRGV